MTFTADQFTPTKWDTAEDKAAFANWLVRFIDGGFKRSAFSKNRYRKLSMCFGMIAHFDIHGFYAEQFSTPERQLRFLQTLLQHRCYGDASYTFSDVEKQILCWVAVNSHIDRLVAKINHDNENAERTELARLKAKYE
jgi:hypothetical protein